MARPNIAIFNGRLLPASETFVRAQAEGLRQFTPYYVGARRVEGLELPSDRTLVVNQGKWLGAAQEFLFKQTGYAPQFEQQVKQLQPALIHAHFGVCGALALPIANRLELPLVTTYHGFDACMTDAYARRDSITTKVYLRRREKLKRETRLFIAVSQFIRDRLVKQGFPEGKIRVHYIGVDTDLFQPKPDLQRQPIVLFVGRLTEKKGCEYLIKAMQQVQSIVPSAQLVVIGDGALRASLETLAQSSLRHVSFLGVQPPETVRYWMNKALVFCVPSIQAQTGDCEGFGIVFAEAQAMGLPCVSFASGGIPEAIAHEETGLLAAEHDWRTLADYIVRLLKEPIWQQFSDRGRKRMQTQFNLHQQTQALETLYQSVLDNTL